MAFEQHCIVELMGHQRCAGKVSEEQIGGATFIRVDIPKTPNRDGFTKFYAPGAIYCITPTDEQAAQMAARAFNQTPIQQWQLSGLLPEPEEDDDYSNGDYNGDEDEDLIDDNEHDYNQFQEPIVYPDAFEGERDVDDSFDEDLSARIPSNDDEPHNDIGNPDFQVPSVLSKRELERCEVANWATRMLASNALILDTETTGLNDGEIVQIAIIDCTGEVMMDRLVKPTQPIPMASTAIHGITDEMVKDEDGWEVVAGILEDTLPERDVVIYNAVYDRKMMHQSGEKAGIAKIEWRELATFHCAMEAYAKFYGDWNDYRQSYRWQKLTDACDQQGIPEPNAPAHSALGDCLRTLELLKIMAAWQPFATSEIPL